MNCYKIIFTGRKKGALGVFYQIQETVFADNEDEAVKSLYKDYEHISITSITAIV